MTEESNDHNVILSEDDGSANIPSVSTTACPSEGDRRGSGDDYLVRIKAQVMTVDQSCNMWIPMGGGGLSIVGIREMAVSKGRSSPSYVIDGRRMSDRKSILWCTLDRQFIYTDPTPTFHHWQCSGRKYGLTFQSAHDGNSFSKALKNILSTFPQQEEPAPAISTTGGEVARQLSVDNAPSSSNTQASPRKLFRQPSPVFPSTRLLPRQAELSASSDQTPLGHYGSPLSSPGYIRVSADSPSVGATGTVAIYGGRSFVDRQCSSSQSANDDSGVADPNYLLPDVPNVLATSTGGIDECGGSATSYVIHRYPDRRHPTGSRSMLLSRVDMMPQRSYSGGASSCAAASCSPGACEADSLTSHDHQDSGIICGSSVVVETAAATPSTTRQASSVADSPPVGAVGKIIPDGHSSLSANASIDPDYPYVRFTTPARPPVHEYSLVSTRHAHTTGSRDWASGGPGLSSHSRRESMSSLKKYNLMVSPHPTPRLPIKKKRRWFWFRKSSSTNQHQHSASETYRCQYCNCIYSPNTNRRGACHYAPPSGCAVCIRLFSCICCAEMCAYHCMGSGVDDPCVCDCSQAPGRNCLKWALFGFLSLLVPCLWCYWPLYGCYKCGVSLGCCGQRHKPALRTSQYSYQPSYASTGR